MSGDIKLDPQTGAEPRPGRLPVQVVEHLHRLVGGDPVTERQVEGFIKAHFKVPDLMRLPADVAREIILRPGDFLTKVREFSEPTLKL